MLLPEILKSPLALVISAKRYSGKSFLIKELLNNRIIKKRYDIIYVFSDTSLLDDTWKSVDNENVLLDDEYSEEKLENLLDHIKEDYKDGEKKEKILIVIDDLIEAYKRANKSVLTKLATRGRHFGIDYVFTTQKYNALPPVIRANSTSKLFFKISNKGEMKAIENELSSRDYSEKVISTGIDKITKEPYTYFLSVEGEEPKFYKGQNMDIEEVKLNT